MENNTTINWSNHHDNILTSIQKYSNFLYKEHYKTYENHKKKLQKYRIPIMLISATSGFLSVLNSSYIPADINKWISLFVGVCNFSVFVFTLIKNFKNIDTTMNNAHDNYMLCKKMNDEISILLKLSNDKKQKNGNEIVYYYFKKFEFIFAQSKVLFNDLNNMEHILEIENFIQKNEHFEKVNMDCKIENGVIQIDIENNKKDKNNAANFNIMTPISIKKHFKNLTFGGFGKNENNKKFVTPYFENPNIIIENDDKNEKIDKLNNNNLKPIDNIKDIVKNSLEITNIPDLIDKVEIQESEHKNIEPMQIEINIDENNNNVII